MESTNALLPQDAKGRVRVPVERRELLLGEFERCGMTVSVNASTSMQKGHKRQKLHRYDVYDEVKILDAAVKPLPRETRPSSNVSDYLLKLARLGGYLARAGDPPRGESRHFARPFSMTSTSATSLVAKMWIIESTRSAPMQRSTWEVPEM